MKKTLLLLFYPILLWSAEYQPDNAPDESIATQTENTANSAIEGSKQHQEEATTNNDTIRLDDKQLLASPNLLKRTMQSVVITKQIEALGIVLPIYEKLADADPTLTQYAKGMLAHSQGDLKTAINYYRNIIAKQPNMSAVRFDLAMALTANRQHGAALAQLEKLKSDQLPASATQQIDQTIKYINHQENWQLNVNAYYRQENNINNAPKQRKMQFQNGTLTFPKQEKAQGIHLTIGAKKHVDFNDNFYSNLQFDANTDFYWTNHKHDDLSVRLGAGLGYQDAKLKAELQPFVKKRFFGSKPYSFSHGAKATFNYKLTQKWQVSNYIEWSYETFDERHFLNGQRKFIGFSVSYLPNPQQYWTVGINYYDQNTQTNEDTFDRQSIFAGWGQEWDGGLSTKLTLATGIRNHKGVDFFNIRRKDKEYSAKLAVWHRSIHLWGFTPRLVGSWQKNHSNHFYYNRNKSRFNIEFSKNF